METGSSSGDSDLKRQPQHRSLALATALVAALAAALAGALGAPALPARAGDLRHDCLLWSRSRGAEQVAIANRIGREQLLTKNVRLAEEQPNASTSLYRWSDIQQLCRRQ